MIYYSKAGLTEYLNILKYKVYSKNSVKYINLPCSFDLETSSWEESYDKRACMYIWMMGIDNYVFYGRTWPEWLEALSVIIEKLQLGEQKKLIIYVHNLAYEFQWIRKYLTWEKVFSTELRKPLEAFTDTGLVFRCSYLLSGESLSSVGKKLTIQKKDGQLDYKLKRNSKTVLSDEELEYCEYDILVVNEYIRTQIERNGGKITKIPLTKTGYVRNYCRKECLPNNSGAWFRYRRLMNQLVITPAEYRMLHAAFQGGFTHASARKSHKVFDKVASYDFTSSYPAVMVLEKFPMSKGYRIENITPEQFKYFTKYYSCLMKITFYDIDEKLTADHPISAYRCDRLFDEIYDNGRVVSASELTLTLTDIDFKIIQEFYSWSSFTVNDFYYYYKGYLPTPYVRSVLGLYKDKTELKGVKGREHDYMLYKELLNSSYGMMVTNIIRDECVYKNTGEWECNAVDVEKKIEIYNNSKKRFLSYAWGVWVTAYARYNLFTAIKACSADYIYADTDSIKLTNHELYQSYFEDYNNQILDKINKAAEHHRLDASLFMPETIKGETKVIGQWDYEGTYDRFKTLGAKRYMTESAGDLSLTVSGINKKTAVPYLKQKYKDPFKAFDNELYIPPEYTGKNIHTYIDNPQQGKLKDYNGIEAEYSELSSVHLSEADYHLSVAQSYINYILSITEESIDLWEDLII